MTKCYVPPAQDFPVGLKVRVRLRSVSPCGVKQIRLNIDMVNKVKSRLDGRQTWWAENHGGKSGQR